MTKFNFVITRNYHEPLYIMVEAETNDEIQSVNQLLVAVRTAVTQWFMDVVSEHDPAVSVLKYAGNDVNIMDISDYFEDDEHLKNCLKIQGVFKFGIIKSESRQICWHIDTRLLDENKFDEFMSEVKDSIDSEIREMWFSE